MTDGAGKVETHFSSKTMLWVSILCGGLAFVPFAYFGDVGRARACFVMVAITALIIMLRWELHARPWFQMLMVALFIAQLGAIVLFPWSDHSYPGVSLLALGVAYLLIYYAAIKGLELIFARR